MGEEVMIRGNGSNSVINETENLNVDFLEDDGLTVSRFVSDSVTRGMLNAVDTEDAEKIAQTEIELSRLKEVLLSCRVGSEENETSHSRLVLDEACKDEHERRLLDQNVESCSCGKKSLALERTKEIAGLRQELELISKLLSCHENGDIEALEDQKRNDLLQRKISGSLGNGKHIGSVMSKPENTEYLRALSREQLINHYKSEMNQLKREHDYTMQEMTEEYFSIKRRYLNLEVCGSFSSLKKDKEFDALRKKIPDIISKLDKVLLEDEGRNVADSKRQLDSLLLENRQLKDSLSEADHKMSQLIRKLESDVEDLHVEGSIYEDVYGSFVGEFVKQIQRAKEEADLEHCSIKRESYELTSRDLVESGEESESKIDLEDSCVESYMEEEKERLKEEIYWLECLVKEKEDLVQIIKNDLATEREKLEMMSHQMNNLQFEIDQQAEVIQDKDKELKAVSARGLEKTEGYEMEISELRQNLELVRKNMKITENEKMKYELKLSSTQAEQQILQSQFVSTVLSLAKWSQGFDNLECLVAEKTKRTNSRLKSMEIQINDLSDEVDELKVRESMYKQLMEKKTCDLLKAETEVDLLGDQIDSHLDILEKIYIALDHYSQILKHYPGIIEILKLVRRELRRNSKR